MSIRTWNEEKILLTKGQFEIYIIGASEIICKWILLIFFWKNYVLRKGKILMFIGREIKRKVAIRMDYSQAEIDIQPKITLQPEFFLWPPFFLSVIKRLFKNI